MVEGQRLAAQRGAGRAQVLPRRQAGRRLDRGSVGIEVADDDLGRVIGRGGRVANALRSVMKAAATREEKRVVVDILD